MCLKFLQMRACDAIKQPNLRNMRKPITLTAIIEVDQDGGYVARCVELDIASQGETVEEARANVLEAVELFFESASQAEIQRKLKPHAIVTPLVPSIPASLNLQYA
jgi:predicted RNase H-like HicB family nuclease